jgi:quinolinate synthase
LRTSTTVLIERIAARKKGYGSDLVILGHHYQSDEIIDLTDIQGDSLELASRIPDLRCRYVVFCGVHFMAESAALIAEPGQKVFIPDQTAGCVMANMAPSDLVEKVLEILSTLGSSPVPLAYVNSSAAVKALCGRYGGSVCTSANAGTMLDWALKQGERVLFLPDMNLGMNTAHLLGLSGTQLTTLDIRSAGAKLDLASAAKARLLLWPGVCAIHHRFKTRHAQQLRADHPGARIVLHPECSPELVAVADATGSTSFIIDYVRQAPAGSTIYVGTEANLVRRLMARYQGEKVIHPVAEVTCSNMAKITLPALADLLDTLDSAEPVTVPEAIRGQALLALERMLDHCGK